MHLLPSPHLAHEQSFASLKSATTSERITDNDTHHFIEFNAKVKAELF